MAISQPAAMEAFAKETSAPVNIRPAKLEEDDVLSRILCNAFLPVWNHNWFHAASEPLKPVDHGTVNGKTPKMTGVQKSRVRFYRSVIRLTRLIGGLVLVVEAPSSSDNGEATTGTDFGAVLLWMPPSKRLGAYDIVTIARSGLLGLMLPWHYGLTGLYRVQIVFESNVQSMLAETLPGLPPHGFREDECAFVQMLVANPNHAGKGYASKLLDYQIDQHFAQYPDRPVALDSTTAPAIRAYERLGFKLLGQRPLKTDTDENGIRLKGPVDEQAKQRIKDTCVQRVLAKLP